MNLCSIFQMETSFPALLLVSDKHQTHDAALYGASVSTSSAMPLVLRLTQRLCLFHQLTLGAGCRIRLLSENQQLLLETNNI